jgi:acetolactate synthase regulatory subunit
MPRFSLQPIRLDIEVTQNVTVLPRILQILSRRGIILESISTEQIDDLTAVLHCSLLAPTTWHDPIGPLLLRLVDVKDVKIRQIGV